MKGAYIMWFAKIIRGNRKTLSQEAATSSFEPLTVAEATKRHDAAIKNMVASIAKHDFTSARQYSYEETRLKSLIRDLANQGRPITSPVTAGPALGKTAP
jgi:altronate dehydratase